MTDAENDEGVDEAGLSTESEVGADVASPDSSGGPDDTAEGSTSAHSDGDGDVADGDVAEGDAEGDGDGAAVPAGSRDRLEALQHDIDEVRQRVADPTDQGDNKFIQSGEADDDGQVDDTIAPPG